MPSGLEFIDLGSNDRDVVAVRLTGKLTGAAMADLIQRLESIRSEGRKARLYVDLTERLAFELDVVREKLTHMSTLWNGIERCAYVVDKQWMHAALRLVDAVTPMHLRAFGTDEREAAQAWLLEREGETPATAASPGGQP